MNILQYIFKLIYRVRWWLLVLPLVSVFIVFLFTRTMPKIYNVSTTIYTGVASGFNIESAGPSILDMNSVNNELDNLINVINSQRTLEEVSLQLLARTMAKGNASTDTEDVMAESYSTIRETIPQDLLDQMDGKSEEELVEIFKKYKKHDRENFIYNLLNRETPYFGIKELQKLVVRRLQNSDMLQVSYACDDPGIAYNTLNILNKEFVSQYQQIRFGETDSVIDYFRSELQKRGDLLKLAEDSLIEFNVQNMVINYEEQTRQMAIQSRDFNLEYSQAEALYSSSSKLVEELEERIGSTVNIVKNNNTFIQKMQELSNASYQKAVVETFDNKNKENGVPSYFDTNVTAREDSLLQYVTSLDGERSTKEWITSNEIMKEWFIATLNKTKAKIALEVLTERKANLDRDYVFYSPVGAMLKQKDRQIKFNETSFLDIQNSLNYALTRRQSIQMGTASLKVLNPPLYPLESEPSKQLRYLLAAWFATLFLIVFYVILMDRIDTTLKDKSRTEDFTGGTVMGGFPAPFKGKYAKYQAEGDQFVLSSLGHSIRFYLNKQYPNTINLLSLDPDMGKTFVGSKLAEELNRENIRVKLLNWEKDFDTKSQEYIWADNFKSIYPNTGNEQVLFVELPPLSIDAVPQNLVGSATLNILVLRADRSWSNQDQILFDRLKKETKDTPLVILLNYIERDDMTDMVGLLPPYTKVRSLFYRLFNFEFKLK
ncbi:MAG: GumC family protein [Bacteroidales bacterium]